MLGRLLAAGALALTFAFGAPPAGAADPPIADPAAKQVQVLHAALLDTMKRGHELGMQGRYKALEPAIDGTFDFQVMLPFIVGPAWTTMSDADHKSLIAAFRRLTLASYASNFDSYGDRIVQTTLIPFGDKPVPLLYRMRQAGDSWRIIDIFLEGYVSELATRRSDFSATVGSGGAPALTKKMSDLADALLSGETKPSH